MIYLIFAFYLLARLYPYFFSPVPLGYDAGLYIYLWQKYSELGLVQFTSLPKWLVEVYPPFIAIVGKLFGLLASPATFAIPLSIIISSVLFHAVYLFVAKRYDKNTTLWIMFFLAASIVQYKFFWWFYIKNILALAFVFYYLNFKNQKPYLSYLFVVLTILTHQPTSIILFLAIIFSNSFSSLIPFFATFTLYYIPNFSLTVAPFLPGVSSTIGEASGTFWNIRESLFYMLHYLPFSLYGLYVNRKAKNKLVPQLALVSFLIPLFGLFLSRRFIPFFDIFALILAGLGASKFFKDFPKLKYFYIHLVIISISLFVFQYSAAAINIDEFEEIKLLTTTPSSASILVTDNEYTPWIYGYTNRRSITPGFGEFDIYWTTYEWQQYWLSGNQTLEISLLQKLPQPLYIWKGDKNALTKFSLQGPCFERFSWHTYRFVCQQ